MNPVIVCLVFFCTLRPGGDEERSMRGPLHGASTSCSSSHSSSTQSARASLLSAQTMLLDILRTSFQARPALFVALQQLMDEDEAARLVADGGGVESYSTQVKLWVLFTLAGEALATRQNIHLNEPTLFELVII